MIVIELLHPRNGEVQQRWELSRRRSPLSIGRCQSNDIVLNSNFVSRRHLELMPAGDDWQLRNLGKNGCYVNGQKAQIGLLRGGAFEIQLGKKGPSLRIDTGKSQRKSTQSQPARVGKQKEIYVSQALRELAARQGATISGNTQTMTQSQTGELPCVGAVGGSGTMQSGRSRG